MSSAGFLPCLPVGRYCFETMPKKLPKIEMRIINVTFPRFVIVNHRRYWTGRGWSRRLRRALLYAHADFLRNDIEMLKKNCG